MIVPTHAAHGIYENETSKKLFLLLNGTQYAMPKNETTGIRSTQA